MKRTQYSQSVFFVVVYVMSDCIWSLRLPESALAERKGIHIGVWALYHIQICTWHTHVWLYVDEINTHSISVT